MENAINQQTNFGDILNQEVKSRAKLNEAFLYFDPYGTSYNCVLGKKHSNAEYFLQDKV
jgi:hypothetical protein